tara:strand:+ start:153283 stop:155034 length:1752 start_codon:yes stop_codon:yes gene_type:complete
MSSNIFLNETLFWPILIGALLLWILFIFKEWPDRYSKRFWLKTGIALLTITALALIFLKPTSLSEEKIKTGLVLTNGYDKEVLDSIKRDNNDLIIINYLKGESILREDVNASSLIILGEGIQDYDLWQLENIPTQYLGSFTNSGVTSLYYKEKNTIGNKLLVQGEYKNAKPGTKLILEAPGEIAVDSVILNSGKDETFQLSTDLKVEGKFLYKLIEKDSSGKKFRSNPIPVKIIKRLPLKILIIEAFPTFETKYLKNYLAQAGQELSVRTQLTTRRYKLEYFNIDKKEPISFSEKILQAFDLLIMDEVSLKNLSKNEIALLKRSIKDDGLGVFLQPSLNLFNSKNELAALKFRRDNNTKIKIDPNSKIQFNKYPYQFSSEKDLQPLISIDNYKIAAYQKKGLGRVGTSVLENTYQLVLDGNVEQYKKLWSKIVERISKKARISSEFKIDQFIVYKDEPFNFTLRTEVEMPFVDAQDGGRIPLKQDLNISNLWTGKIYPNEKGWQSLTLVKVSSISLEYYVSEKAVWKSMLAENTSMNNKRYFKDSKNEDKIKSSREPIDPIWFYGIFLLGMGYLWLEPKLYEA